MKKFVIAAAILAFFTAEGAHAEDISIRNDLYVSKPVIMADGEKITELEVGKEYSTINISFTAETKYEHYEANNLTAAAAFYNGEILEKNNTQTLTKDRGITEFNLILNDITSTDQNDKIKIFLWEDMEACTNAVTINSKTESDDSDMETIRKRIERDSNLYNISTDPSSLLAKLGSNGRFSDINYNPSDTMTNWSPSGVFKNAIVMCQAYFSEGNRWYHNAELKTAIDNVLNDWAINKYECSNWWYNEIDVPQNLSVVLMYPFDESEPYLDTLKEIAKKGMPDIDESNPHKSSDTGGNLTDKLQTAIKIAAATRDADSMKNVVTYLLDNELSVFNHANNGEGIMTDYTFHQHGSFFYNGSYGSVFCSGINRMLGYLEDTEFMVSERALNTYADFILEGHSWFFKNNGSDFAPFGRAISRNNAVGGSVRSNSLGAVNILTRLPRVERREELLKLKSDRLEGSDNSTTAAKHFYLSDMTVMHRPDFYVGVRTSSNRNRNTEYMNGENSKATFISDGTTTILKTGNEYRNIFAVWDWSRIPGTTTEYLRTVPTMSSTYQYGTREFVGGTADGKNAVSAMDYSRRGVTAKKAYFMFDNGFTALGAGINGTTSNTEVCTTMNQCIQNGYTVYSNGAENSFYQDEVSISNAKWVLNDNVGYYFPNGENVIAKAEKRSGNWHNINSSQSSGTVSQNVFTLYTSHGITPQNDSYEYTVLPSVTREELREYSENPSISIIQNDVKAQAVWSKNDNSAGIVFWTRMTSRAAYTESVTIPAAVTGMDKDLVIDALRDPCILMLNKTEDGYDLFVSNPKNNTLRDTYIGINRKLSGANAAWDGEKTIITVNFPQGLERGSTVKISLTE